jgi:phenylacetate-coenzyme A ligase PaaK-like adenylate-forming protein
VVFVDGHCRVPSPTLLRDMVDLFERSGADCLARPQPQVPGAPGTVARAIAAARASPFGHSTASTIYSDAEGPVSPVSAGAMYRREVFDRVGNFDPSFDACEDVEFNWRVERAGLACWSSPKLGVRYEPRRTMRALLRQMSRYGLGRARLHRKHPASFRPEALVPALFVLGLPALLVAPWLPIAGALAVVAPYASYAVLSVVFSVRAAARHGWDLLPWLPFAFLTIHAGLGWGYLRGLATRRPRDGAGAGEHERSARAASQRLLRSPGGAAAVAGRVVQPMAGAWRRSPVRALTPAAEALLGLSADEAHAVERVRLRALLLHAHATVPFHRARIDAAGANMEDPHALLAALPPLTRADVAARAADLLSSAYRGRALLEARTGGTTSAPVPFLQSRRASAFKDAATVALRRRMGWHPGMRVAWLWGAMQDAPSKVRGPWRRAKAALTARVVDRERFLPANDLSPARLDAFAAALARFRPDVLQAYPSAGDLLARRVRETGASVRIPTVVLTAEPVFDVQRERIREAFGARVWSFYGARECGWIAADCVEGRLHVNTAGVVVRTTEDGRILVTDLVNGAMPLIAYEIGDRGALGSHACRCGDPRPHLASIEGRLNDVFVLPSGRRVPGVVVDVRAYRVGQGILETQLVQERPGALHVRYVPGPGFRPEHVETLRARLESTFAGELTLAFESVPRILPEPNGKVRYCVSRLPQEVGG